MSHIRVCECEDKKTWRVEIWHKSSGAPHVYEEADNTYVKAGFFCVYERAKNRTTKWPVGDIFRIIEDYPDSARRTLAD